MAWSRASSVFRGDLPSAVQLLEESELTRRERQDGRQQRDRLCDQQLGPSKNISRRRDEVGPQQRQESLGDVVGCRRDLPRVHSSPIDAVRPAVDDEGEPELRGVETAALEERASIEEITARTPREECRELAGRELMEVEDGERDGLQTGESGGGHHRRWPERRAE